MNDKEKSTAIFDLKAIILSCFIGIITFYILCFGEAILIKTEALPFGAMGILSKLSLFIAALISCAYSRKKGRGERFINCLSSCVLMFAFAVLSSAMYKDREWDTAGAVICLLMCIISCFIMLLPKKKNSKLHKRKRRRQ